MEDQVCMLIFYEFKISKIKNLALRDLQNCRGYFMNFVKFNKRFYVANNKRVRIKFNCT